MPLPVPLEDEVNLGAAKRVDDHVIGGIDTLHGDGDVPRAASSRLPGGDNWGCDNTG